MLFTCRYLIEMDVPGFETSMVGPMWETKQEKVTLIVESPSEEQVVCDFIAYINRLIAQNKEDFENNLITEKWNIVLLRILDFVPCTFSDGYSNNALNYTREIRIERIEAK